MISYDEKKNTVTVSGSFDAEEVADRLCSDAGKVITDVQVARGNQMNPGAKVAPKQLGKEGYGHGHGPGPQAHGHGGKQEKTKHVKFGMDDDERVDRRGHHGPGPQAHGHGGKQEKTKHVKFGMDDDERVDRRGHHDQGHGQGHGLGHGQGQGHGHGNGHGGKPKVVTTTAMSRNEAPRAQQPASMMAMAPMRMPTPAPSMTMMPQAMATPSIWPAAPGPEWGYSAPAYGYGHAHAGGAPAGGYYGGPACDHGAYGAYAGGYGRNPYQPQYYEEEPSAGCSVM